MAGICTGGEQEAPSLETALRDPLDRSDPGSCAARNSYRPRTGSGRIGSYGLYGGVGIETSSSADHHVVKGQLERKKKHIEIRGLNRNCSITI